MSGVRRKLAERRPARRFPAPDDFLPQVLRYAEHFERASERIKSIAFTKDKTVRECLRFAQGQLELTLPHPEVLEDDLGV